MLFEKSTRYLRVRRLCLMMLLAFGVTGLTGCVHTQPTLKITVPESLKACLKTERPPVEGLTVGRLATYSIQQEADLQACDARREALVSIIEAANEAQKPKRWWQK